MHAYTHIHTVGRGPSFRNRRGSMKGSLRGSFHGNRGNSFRGGSIRGRRGSKRGSFRVPKPGMSPGGKVPPSNMVKPKVETRLDISLFYQVLRSCDHHMIIMLWSCDLCRCFQRRYWGLVSLVLSMEVRSNMCTLLVYMSVIHTLSMFFLTVTLYLSLCL